MTTLDQQWADLYRAGKVRWMPGMMTDHGRVVDVPCAKNGVQMPVLWTGDDITVPGPTTIAPDFSDPATIGCLESMCCELYHCDRIRITIQPGVTMDNITRGHWSAQNWRGASFAQGEFETDDRDTIRVTAILAAIQAAPPRSTK